MALSSKGFTLSISAVIILVVGLITIAGVMGMWGSVEGDTGESLDNSTTQTGTQTNKSQCVTKCRFDYPKGGAEFENCKASC